MDNGLPMSSVPPISGHRTNGAGGGNNFAAAAAAALAAAAAASQHHMFNAIRAVAASSAPFNPTVGVDPGSGDSNSPLSVQLDYAPETAEAKLIDYRHEKVAAFEIDGEIMMCLPQAYELFLKNLVGGLHTVYTKLKRLEIAPFVCNVEQVRALRSIGAIQPGVNRCKLISCRDFDILYEDCASSSSRPGRPPKRSPIFTASSATMAPSSIAASGASSIGTSNGYSIGNSVGAGFGLGNTPAPSDYAPMPTKRSRISESSTASALEKFNTAFNPMAGFMNSAAVVGGNSLNPNQLFPLFPFAPQNFMLSHFMNTNPNASLLAKQWGEHFGALSGNNGGDNATPIDATSKGDGGQSGESAQNDPANGIGLSRTERNTSWTSTSGRESDDFMKFSHNVNARDSANVVNGGDGNCDRRRNGDYEGTDEQGGNSSDCDDGNALHSTAEDRERKEGDKDDDDEQAPQWANSTNSANGGEASQLLRSMDLGVNSQFFGAPPSLAAAAVAAAASASQQNNRQRPNSFGGLQASDQAHYSSVENILFSVLGLVQVAASTARVHEEQIMKEKVEAMRMYENEKQERSRLEKELRKQRRFKTVYLKQLRKCEKQNTDLTKKMLVLTEEVRKRNKTAGGHSEISSESSASKQSSVAMTNNATVMTSPVAPPKRPSFSMTKQPEISVEYRQKAIDDCRVSPLSESRNGDVTTVGESRATLENGGEVIRNAHGRMATLFVKNEPS